jgi:hypothetical protein
MLSFINVKDALIIDFLTGTCHGFGNPSKEFVGVGHHGKCVAKAEDLRDQRNDARRRDAQQVHAKHVYVERVLRSKSQRIDNPVDRDPFVPNPNVQHATGREERSGALEFIATELILLEVCKVIQGLHEQLSSNELLHIASFAYLEHCSSGRVGHTSNYYFSNESCPEMTPRVPTLNRGYAHATIISSKYHGQNLLFHLASLYPHSTPQGWQQKLNHGDVTLNGVTATGSESVTLGQTLVWNRPPWIEPDSPQHFEVLFEDPHLLAVNKPGGLPTLPGGGFMENTLLRLVQKRTHNANPVHRLGRATTGIVLFARTSQAASNLFANWNTAKIQKIYRALAQNCAQHDAYEILTPIGLVQHPLIGSVWAANPGGKPFYPPSTVQHII